MSIFSEMYEIIIQYSNHKFLGKKLINFTWPTLLYQDLVFKFLYLEKTQIQDYLSDMYNFIKDFNFIFLNYVS